MSESNIAGEMIEKKEFLKFFSFYISAKEFFGLQQGAVLVDCCSGSSFLGLYWLDRNPDDKVTAIDKTLTEKHRETLDYFVSSNPKIRNRYEFLQQDITQPDFEFPECNAVIAVHACGSLTDIIIDKCMKQGLPLAVMPCCYNSKRIWWQKYSPCIEFEGDLGRYADELRLAYLKHRYKNAKIETISPEITPMNRILLAGKKK